MNNRFLFLQPVLFRPPVNLAVLVIEISRLINYMKIFREMGIVLQAPGAVLFHGSIICTSFSASEFKSLSH